MFLHWWCEVLKNERNFLPRKSLLGVEVHYSSSTKTFCPENFSSFHEDRVLGPDGIKSRSSFVGYNIQDSISIGFLDFDHRTALDSRDVFIGRLPSDHQLATPRISKILATYLSRRHKSFGEQKSLQNDVAVPFDQYRSRAM